MCIRDSCTIEFTALDHGIPSMAYRISEHDTCNIDKELVTSQGLTPGPWMGILKTSYLNDAPCMLYVNGMNVESTSMHGLLIHNDGRSIGYATDFGPSEKNKELAADLVRNVDVLYCESMYLEDDIELAQKSMHLTVRHTAELAEMANVKALRLFHFSPRYAGTEQFHVDAQKYFHGEITQD